MLHWYETTVGIEDRFLPLEDSVQVEQMFLCATFCVTKKKKTRFLRLWWTLSGWGGIRTHGRLTTSPVFKTGAINRSATHPAMKSLVIRFLRMSKKVPYRPRRGVMGCQLLDTLTYDTRISVLVAISKTTDQLTSGALNQALNDRPESDCVDRQR